MICIFLFSFLLLAADPPDWQPITGTQYSMILFARIIFNGDYFEESGDNMTAAFGPGGESDCRGIGGWEALNPNGFWYYNIVGNINGEEISFKIYDEATDMIYDCDQTFIFQDNATIGSPTQPYLLSVNSSLITGTLSLITTTPPVGNPAEAEISNGTYFVNPNSVGYYELPAEAGTYNVTATLAGYNSATITDVEVIQGQNTENVDFTLIDWEPISGTQYSMAAMCEVYFGDDLIIADGINHLGAFGPGGETDCRGVAVWQQPNLPYWDGYWFITIVGNNQNEEITFKVFESSSSAVYECWETVNFENNSTLGSPEDPFTLNIDFSINQVMNLGENWNWISFYVHPLDLSIPNIFGSLGANVYQVKNQTQSATYYPSSNNWVGNLTTISDGEAYLVHMIDAVDNFTVNGEPISIDTSIYLTAGWNWIAYYPRTIMTVGNALQSIEANVIQAKSQTQTANYINPPGTWVGDLLQMEPNQGYKINMSSSDQLIYGNTDSWFTQTKPANNSTDDVPDWSIITGTEFSMVVMASIELEGEEFDNSGNNLAAAFGPGGETDCRSIAVWQEANPPYYENGFWYFTVVGDVDGEEIEFWIYDETTDEVYLCEETITFLNNETYGSPTDPFLLSAEMTGTGNEIIQTDWELKVYPNPFNPSTTISFLVTQSSDFAKIEIYNLKGQKVKSFAFPNGSLGTSESVVVWNGTDNNNQPVSSGVYFVKMKAGQEIRSKKILLMK